MPTQPLESNIVYIGAMDVISQSETP